MPRVRTHPGEILREEFLAPLGLTADKLAKAIDVPVRQIHEILQGRRGVTGQIALRLSKQLETTPEFWLNLQVAYDASTRANSSKKT
jgi:antitoxin HigA-1